MNNLFTSTNLSAAGADSSFTTTVVVTTVPGQPSFEMSGRPTVTEIAAAVKARFGKRVASAGGVSVGMPHSFGARIEPTPADLIAADRQVDPMQAALNCHRPGYRRHGAF